MDFLGRIRKLDSSLQRGLDNGFARVFGGKIVPNELEECLKQEIEDFLMQDANGQFLAPNDFRIGVSPKDFDNLSGTDPELPRHLADRMTRYCRNNGWGYSGVVSVRIHALGSLHTGQLKTASAFTEDTVDHSEFRGLEATENPDSSEAAPLDSPQSPASDSPSGGQSTWGTGTAAPGAATPGTAAPGAAPGADAASFGAGTAASYREPESSPEASSPSFEQSSADVDADRDFARSEEAAGEQFPTASRPVVAAPPPPPAAPARSVTLLLQDGSSRVFQVKEGSNIIGRGTASDFRLPDTGVSRQHAEITWDGYDAILVDLHSTNGTIVNGEPIENWLLADGDEISLGHSVLEVRIR